MSDTVKNIISIILAIIIAAALAIASYNTFFKKSETTEKTEITENNNNQSNSDNQEVIDDTFDHDASFTISEDKIDNSVVSSIEYKNKTYEFGIDKESSLPGIVLNPNVIGSDSKYLVFCSSDSGYIVANESEDAINPYSDDFDSIQCLYCRDTSLTGFNTKYINDQNFGIMWKGDSENLDESANINVKFFNFDDFTFEAIFNITVTKNEQGLYAIESIDSCNYLDNGDNVVSDNALNILTSNLESYSIFGPKAVTCEKISEIYYNSMINTNGYEVIMKSKVNRSIYPCYATSFIFNEMPGVIVTIYSNDYGEYLGYAEFSKGESLSILENELNIEY